ncbi:MAG: helix-turn-helix domain-containing protein, partial [Eubacteriales bacterium]|nr:helix-turn-helix domain-containing protein [Eubacteriales bacterium]
MYKIGELSKLCRLPVKTLRYYDSVGLLVPDKIDRFTGYRYYSAAQLADCNRIVALKELGFSLDEIRRHLSADSADGVVSLLDAKAEELKSLLFTTESQIKRLEAVIQIITEGEKKMFDIIIRSADSLRVAYARQIFKTKTDAFCKIKEMRNGLPKHITGARSLIINYETEYRESDFDLAVCVELNARLPHGCVYEDRTVTIPGEAASLVCREEDIDAAYRSMSKQLDEQNAQIVGAFYEFYHDDGTVELKVPVYCPSAADSLKDDNSELSFVNDEEALGKWKLLDIVPSEEQFLYGHEKCKHSGWLDELYFLENGEKYWALGGWTKGFLITESRHRFNN